MPEDEEEDEDDAMSGTVMSAFKTNSHQIAQAIENKAAGDILFTSSQHDKRKMNKKLADDQVEADKQAIAHAKAKAKADVDSVKNRRASIISQAKEAIKE